MTHDRNSETLFRRVTRRPATLRDEISDARIDRAIDRLARSLSEWDKTLDPAANEKPPASRVS